MKRRKAGSAAIRAHATVRTGERCPESGPWFAVKDGKGAGSREYSQFISEGSLMPAMEGSPAQWLPALEGELALDRMSGG